MIIQPASLSTTSALPTRAAPPSDQSEPALPSDQAHLSGTPPQVPPQVLTETKTLAPQAAASPAPPTTLTLVAEEPGWKGELLELKGRMDYLYGVQTARCGQWWQDTVKQLPAPAGQMVQDLASHELTEARRQDPDATIARVAFPIGVNVNGLMLAAVQTETDARLNPEADRGELLKHNLFVTAITGEMIGRLHPDDVAAAQGEAGIGTGQANRFAEALATRLSPEDVEQSQRAVAEGTLFQLALHPSLPEMAAGLSEHVGTYQGAILQTNQYLGGLQQVQGQQNLVAREVGAFFEKHPEALG